MATDTVKPHPKDTTDGAYFTGNLAYSQEEGQLAAEQKPKNTGYKTFFGQNIATSMTISQSQYDSEKSFCEMSTRRKCCFYVFFFVDFCAGTFYSLLGPFFPNEARAKGISYTLTGFVFSVYPVVYIIVSPLVGRYLSKIGAKFVFITGIGVCATCAILFGLLEYVDDGPTYAAMSILVRGFQAMGGVAFNTATFAMVATMFPAQMATMFGLLEVAFGLGTMMGPPVGGWLYELGGFKMPFIISGTILLIMGMVCFCFVPGIRESKTRPKSLWSILLSPLVVLVGLTGATGTAGIGFIDVTLSVRLKSEFNLSPGWTGLVFFIAPFMFILSAPVWGRLADKKPAAAPIAMGIGTFVGGVAFWFMGPATFISILDTELWLLMLSYGVMGMAIGTHVVNGKIMAEEARRRGHPKNLETMAMLAGLITSFNSVGSFCGPLVGGYLNDRFQFRGATTIVGIIVMSTGLLLLLCVLLQYLVRRRSAYSQLAGETSMLLTDDSLDTSSPGGTTGHNSRANSSSMAGPETVATSTPSLHIGSSSQIGAPATGLDSWDSSNYSDGDPNTLVGELLTGAQDPVSEVLVKGNGEALPDNVAPCETSENKGLVGPSGMVSGVVSKESGRGQDNSGYDYQVKPQNDEHSTERVDGRHNQLEVVKSDTPVLEESLKGETAAMSSIGDKESQQPIPGTQEVTTQPDRSHPEEEVR